MCERRTHDRDEFILIYDSVFRMTTVATESKEGDTEELVLRQTCTREAVGSRKALYASTDRQDSVATTFLNLADL